MNSEKIFGKAAWPFGLAAAVALVFMMMLTVVAVLSRQLFDETILGLVELSEFALVICIFVAMPAAFLRDENIVVDVIDQMVPRRVTDGLRLLGLVLTLAFLVSTSVAMIEPALAKFSRGQTTLVLEVDLFWYWIPILFGFFLSSAAVAWLLLHRLRHGSPSGPRPSEPA